MSISSIISPLQLLAVTTLSLFTLTEAARSESKAAIAASCIEAIERGDTEEALRISEIVIRWKYLYSTELIADAKECLDTGTGERWEYFSTKGRFLSGAEAQAEEAFIEGADDRKTSREEEEARLNCAVALAQNRVLQLEADHARFAKMKSNEALEATLSTCVRLYETDRDAAILNSTCNEIFLKSGLPDTAHEFDYGALLRARTKLARANLERIRQSKSRDLSQSSETYLSEVCG
ncbi:hypothetical protein [Pseudooceanicola aestuarii]|uniref:hypothetical protein n=1 Tax=Pseudooceanicola aestuarii TaxID=2697319 RepID=UPI0013D085D3|nr:hypothetical protein [Pseudooceanicola aestuarii]